MAKRAASQVFDHEPVRHVRAGEFDQGRTYRVRRPGGAGDHLMIYTIDGAGRIVHRGGETRCTAGDLLLYGPDCPQDYGSHPDGGRWRLAYAHFKPRPHWQPWLKLPAIDGAGAGIGKLSITDAPTAAHVLAALRDAARLGDTPLAHAELLAHNAIERALIWADAANPLTGGRPLDQRVTEAIEYLRVRMTTPITLQDLAAAVHLSPSRLSHLFKAQVGLTPIQYLERQRIERACQLLEQTAMPVQQIAHAVGYASPFYFSLRFKKATGRSPRSYRNAQR